MPILSGSRYEGISLIAISDGTRTRVLMEDREPISVDAIGPNPIHHVVQEGDEIDALARRFGGNERLWWVIADVNDLDFPYELETGAALIIPPRDFFARL